MWNVFENNIWDTRTTSVTLISVFIVNFQQISHTQLVFPLGQSIKPAHLHTRVKQFQSKIYFTKSSSYAALKMVKMKKKNKKSLGITSVLMYIVHFPRDVFYKKN